MNLRPAAALLAPAVAVVLAAPAPASAAKLKLSVASVGNPPATVAPGGQFKVAYQVARRGAGFKSATLRAYLSSAKRKARGAVALTGRATLAKLRRKRALKGRIALGVPAGAPSGSYFLVACVEGVKPRAARTASACRASRSKVALAAPQAGPAPGPGPAPGGAPGGPGPAGGGGGGGGGGPLDTALVPFVPSPRAVSPALDAARAVTQVVGPSGGTLQVAGADGTTYTLQIPFEALSDPEEITMTPLSAIGGLPFSDGHGVELEPDGMQLAAPAKLSIVPPAPVPLGQQAAFSYLGNGADLHLYPTSNREDVLEYELTHFSAYGYGKGTAADREAQSKRVPSDREAWARQNLGRAAQERAIAIKEGRDGDAAQWLAAFAVAWFVWGNEGIRAALTDAKTNDALFEEAAFEYFSWSRQGAILALDAEYPDLVTELHELLLEAADFFAERAEERCLQNKDIFQAWRMLKIERMLQQMGASTTTAEELRVKMDKCARLDLEIDFHLEFLADAPSASLGTDTGTMKFQIRPFASGATATPKTRTDPHLTAATLVPGDPKLTWTWTETVISQQATATGPTIDWRAPGPGGVPREPIVELGMDWGAISENGTYVYCDDSGCTTTPNSTSATYLLALTTLYADEIAAGGIKIRRWDLATGLGNELFASKEIDRSVHSAMTLGTATEEVTMRLLHKPVP